MSEPTQLPLTTGGPTIIEIDIRNVINRTRETSAAVHQLGENHIRTMNMPAGVVTDGYIQHMYETTTSQIDSLRTELKSLYRQLTTYADGADPGDIEFHQVRTSAAAAIELADIYLSPTAFPQRALRMGTAQPPEILRPSITPSSLIQPSTPVQEDTRHTTAATTPSADWAADISSGMQIDDDTVDLGLSRNDLDEYEKLLEEPMEQIFDPPTTDHDPRDGSCGPTSEPALPPLGPGDTEIAVNTSVGLETPVEEIVENKTVRIEDPTLSPGTPSLRMMCSIDICRGCKRAGHTADSCPLTSFQQYRLEESTEKANNNLVASHGKPAENPTKPTPTPQIPASDDQRDGTTHPPPMANQAVEKTATTPAQPTEHPATNPGRKTDSAGKTPTGRPSSSVEAHTRVGTAKITQPDTEKAVSGARPAGGEKSGGTPNGSVKPAKPTEKASNKATGTLETEKKTIDTANKATKPVANVAGKTKTPELNGKKKTVSEQVLHKLAVTKDHSGNKPRTDKGEPKKAEKPPAAQIHEPDTGDSDEIIITHDGTKQAATEPLHHNTRKRHTTTSKPAIAYEFKEANKIPHTPKKTTTCNKPLIPPLPPSLEAPQSPLKKTAVKMTNGESEFAVIPYKKADTTSLRQTNHTRIKISSHRNNSQTGTPSNSDEEPGDLRGMLDERRDRRKTLEESQQRLAKVVQNDNRSKPYTTSSRQYTGSSAKSDRERSGLPDDDRRSQWDPTLDYEHRDNTGPHRHSRSRSRHKSGSTVSDNDGRSGHGKRKKGNEQTRQRYEHSNLRQTRRDRRSDAHRRRRLMEIRERIANVPMQEATDYDNYQFKNMSHIELPVRSLRENCTHVNQLRRWINDHPPRESGMANKMLEWILHFEELKDVPQFTINFGANTLEVAYWWRHFCIEIGILDEEDKVFQEQTCSTSTKTRQLEEGEIQ